MLVLITAFLLLQDNILSSAQKNNACKSVTDYWTIETKKNCYYNPDVLSNVLDTVARHGYKGEAFYTITNDGYILTVFKVHPKKGSDTSNKPPVFIQHGAATNSGCFIDKRNRSLAFALSDLGYEVYLGNIRGSTYSKKHIKYATDSKEFWDYNLDTMSKEDIPSQLKLVANLTGSKILYIGHSLGTTMYFMYASDNPKEADTLIQAGFALAPIVYFKRNIGLYLASPLAPILDGLGINRLFYYEDKIHKLASLVCPLVPHICRGIQFIGLGYSVQFLPEDLLLYYTNWPSTVSVNELWQYAQIHNVQRFQKFDYGISGNIRLYGSNASPLYDLSKVTFPTYLFYGKRDPLVDKEDIEKIYNELGSTVKHIQPVPKNNDSLAFNHFDFLYGGYLREFLYPDLFQAMSQYKRVPLS